MKINSLMVSVAVVFFLVVIPVDIVRGPFSSWQTELRAQHTPVPPAGPPAGPVAPRNNPPGPPPGPPPGKGKPVPEPSILILLGIGLAAGGAYSFIRHRKSKEQV